MPTAYIKKLAKLNHTTVNKLEKFWSQAKEIAKSEGNGKAWGLITTIFQNKLKKEGYKVKAFSELNMKPYSYKGQIITASSKEDAIQQVIASGKRPKFSEEQMYILSNIPEELDHSYDRTGKTLCIAADVNENKELDKLFKGYMICIDSDEEAKNFVEEYKSSMNDFVKIIKELGNNKFFKKLMRD